MPERTHRTWQRLMPTLLSTTIILGIATLLALALSVGTTALFHQTLVVRACGLGNTPTMIADQNPAIPTPVTPTSDPNQPIGFFPGSYYRNQAIAFTEDLSAIPDAPAKDTLKWRWDFGDGTSTASSAVPTHTYQRAGTYNIRVSTYDSVTNSWVDFDSATITLLDHPWENPPVAKATADKSLVTIGEVVSFDATNSQAQVGSLVSYDWNFGDTLEAQGQHVTHAFSIPGRALVTLIITDSRGARSTTVVPVQIVIAIPKVHLQLSTTTAQVGQAITFDASQVELQPGGKVTSYTWKFGDQTPPEKTTTSTITHSYAKPGTYEVQVQVLDDQNTPGTATSHVTIQPAQGNGGAGTIGNSSGSLIVIILGAAVVLALCGFIIYSVLQRRPAPAAAGRASPSRQSARSTSSNSPASGNDNRGQTGTNTRKKR